MTALRLAPASRAAAYRVRLAQTSVDLEAAQRLRFEVFNLELNEGLDSAYLCGLDADVFDDCCEHMLVEEAASGAIVGTYRLQTGQLAAANHGYYSAQEFDFSPFEPVRCETVELGRACVHRAHRGPAVLGLLWRAILRYTVERGARYLIGCSSLTSQDAALGHGMYAALCGEYLCEEKFRTWPQPGYQLPADAPANPCPPPPRLLRAYLTLGAKICGPPALDREFKTIDFLTLLDLATLAPAARQHFLG